MFNNYTSSRMDTLSLSTNPWSPIIEQEQRAEIAQTIHIVLGTAVGVEDEQDFQFISRYHAPLN